MIPTRHAKGAGDFIARRFLDHEVRLHRGGTAAPTGMPLCRLRLTPSEADRAGAILRRHLPGADRDDRHLAAIFCLFAAHALQRHHAGGPWRWSTVLDALQADRTPEDATLQGLVETGLDFWQRPLRLDARGGRRFLGSLVLEGGIPGALLGRAEFAHFLRQLQHDIDAFAVTNPAVAESFAADRSGALPSAWRHTDTLNLAAELLLALKPWRALLPVGTGPAEAVAWLNLNHGVWRAGLPIDLDDAEATRLIGSLLAAGRPVSGQLQPLPALCRRALRRSGEGWSEGLLALGPGLLPAAVLDCPPFTATDMPHRVRFRLEGGEGREIGIAEWHGQGQWRFRPIGATVVPAPADEAAAARLIVDGQEVASLPLPGGEPLSGIPWVLEEEASRQDDEAGILVFAGYGSRSTTRERLFLAADPAEGALRILSGEVRLLGPVGATPRIVHEIRGIALWRDHGERLGIRLATQGEPARRIELAVDVRPPRWKVLAPLASLGPPRLGAPAAAEGARIVRRPASGGDWMPNAGAPWAPGAVDVALIDDDAILDRRRVLILPAEAGLSVSVHDGRRLAVTVRGFAAGSSRIEGSPHARRIAVPGGECLEIDIPELPPAEIIVVTRLGGSGSATDVRHRLPVPLARGGFAAADGRVLANGELRTLAELDGLVVRTSGQTAPRGELLARLTVHGDAVLADTRLGIATSFLGDMPLARMKRTLRQLWSTARSQDSEIRLEVAQNGIVGPQLRIAAFAYALDLSRPRATARLLDRDGKPAGAGADLGLAVLDLTQPAEPLRPLQKVDDAWRLPGPEAPGPWLVIGSEAASGRVRPRVWGQPGQVPMPRGGLAAVVAVADWNSRAAALDARLLAISAAPNHEDATADWSLLDATLAAAPRHAPALSFDLLVAAAQAPALLAHWMLRADATVMPRLAEAEAELPFAWCLVPLRAWLAAGDAVMAKWSPLIGRDLAGQVLARSLDDAATLCPSVAPAAWALRERFGLPHMRDQPGLATLCHPLTQQHLSGRLPADPGDDAWADAIVAEQDWWNLAAGVRRAAPLVAARRALDGQPLAPRLIAAMRFCRHAAEDEFDRVFLEACVLAIARSPDRAGVPA